MTSKGSGEPAHPRSLARAFTVRTHEVRMYTKDPTKNQTSSHTGWLHMRAWRISLWRTKSTIISWDGSITSTAQYCILHLNCRCGYLQHNRKTTISYKYVFLCAHNRALKFCILNPLSSLSLHRLLHFWYSHDSSTGDYYSHWYPLVTIGYYWFWLIVIGTKAGCQWKAQYRNDPKVFGQIGLGK